MRLAMLTSTDGDGDVTESLGRLNPLNPQGLEFIRPGSSDLGEVIPVAGAFAAVLSTFSPSLTEPLAAMKRSGKCFQHAIDTIRLAQLFPKKFWPLPWILGYAAFHSALSTAAASSLNAHGGTLDETGDCVSAPCETAVDELYCLSSAGFEELRQLAVLYRDLREGGDFSNEVSVLKLAFPIVKGHLLTGWCFNGG